MSKCADMQMFYYDFHNHLPKTRGYLSVFFIRFFNSIIKFVISMGILQPSVIASDSVAIPDLQSRWQK